MSTLNRGVADTVFHGRRHFQCVLQWIKQFKLKITSDQQFVPMQTTIRVSETITWPATLSVLVAVYYLVYQGLLSGPCSRRCKDVLMCRTCKNALVHISNSFSPFFVYVWLELHRFETANSLFLFSWNFGMLVAREPDKASLPCPEAFTRPHKGSWSKKVECSICRASSRKKKTEEFVNHQMCCMYVAHPETRCAVLYSYMHKLRECQKKKRVEKGNMLSMFHVVVIYYGVLFSYSSV